MSEEKLIRKVNREIEEIIKQTESITENLKALKRLTEKRAPRTYNFCGVVIRIGKNETEGNPTHDYSDEFDCFE